MASEKDIEKKKEDVLKEINAMYGVAPAEEETSIEEEAAEAKESPEESASETPKDAKNEEAKESEKTGAASDNIEKVSGEASEEEGEDGESGDSSEDEFGDESITEVKLSQPLPKYGEGGKFIPITIGITVVAVVAGHLPYIKYGIPNPAWVRYLYIFFGVVFLFFGIKMIADARGECAIYENIMLGKLVTTGIYSKTRNPIYGGIIFICTGALFMSGNAFMYVLPVAYWCFLSILMKNTEEIILKARFGEKYIDYRNHVNLFIPRKKEPDKDIIKFIFDKKK